MVVYEGGGEDGEAAVRRMHFELFQEVLYLMERRIYGAQRKASPAFAAAAALFVAVEGRVSLWWAMEHAPLGQVSYSDSTRDRLKRLIRIAQRLQAELQLCPVPRATDPSLPQEQWSVVRTAAWQLVQQMPVAPALCWHPIRPKLMRFGRCHLHRHPRRFCNRHRLFCCPLRLRLLRRHLCLQSCQQPPFRPGQRKESDS